MFDILIEVGKVQVTWLEAIAFVLALSCVICNILEIHWGWPLAIISSGLYCLLFYKNKLYGDAGVQIYFILASIWAWWLWLKPDKRKESGQASYQDAAVQDAAVQEAESQEPTARHAEIVPTKDAQNTAQGKLSVRRWTVQERNIVLISWLGLWVLLANLLSRFTDSDVAWADAFPTAGSLIGQILLGKKILENWFIWQAVNVSMVALLAYKALWLTMLLYCIFLAMAILGWRRWSRMTY